MEKHPTTTRQHMAVTAAARVALTRKQTPESHAPHHAAPSRARRPHSPCRPRLRHKHPRCRRLAAARPRLSLTSTRGPARSLADRRGTPLLPTHRSPLSDGALEEDAEDIARRRRPNSDSTSAKDSNRCRAVGADGPQHDSKRAAACVEVLERAARSRSGSPTRWRREP